MKAKVSILTAFILSVLFASCSSQLRTSKNASVIFNLDQAAVQKILESSGLSTASARAAQDLDKTGLFIDVTLYGQEEQTQTAALEGEVLMQFDGVPVNSSVYAKAQIYKYLDSDKKERQVFYSGESSKITVRENGNILTIRLATAILTVTFDSNGGSEVPAQTVKAGSAAKEPENPVKPDGKVKYSRENYAFAGWFTDSELTKPYDFSLPIIDDLTLYAKWLPAYVLVEGTTVNNYLADGRNVRISDLYVCDHEVTQAEYYAVTGEKPSAHAASNVEKSILPVENISWFEALAYCNLLSKSQELTPCYTINNSTDPQQWGSPTNQTPVSCSLSANGYRLPTEAEWEYISTKSYRTNKDFNALVLYSDNSSNNTQEEDNRLVDELGLENLLGNVSEWCYDIYSDTIAKGTGPTGPMLVTGGVNSRVIRGGSFKSSKEECSPSARASASPLAKDSSIGMRLVRTVVYDFKVVKNTVTFDSNGGSSVEVQIIIDGNTATEPAEPAKTGYIFKGWKYNAEDFDFSTPVTQDITLEASWEAIKYRVSFDLNFPAGSTGGSGSPSDYNATYDQSIELPAATTFTAPGGYRFKVWSLNSDSETLTYDTSNPQIKNLVSESNGTITLYAIWEEKEKHYIHYQNYNYDDVDISSLKQDFRESVAVAASEIGNPSGNRIGYEFAGWYYSDEHEAVTTEEFAGWASAEKQEDVYLYAQWTPITYKVRFNSRNNNATGSMSDQTITYDTATELTECNYALTGYNFVGWSTSENSAIKDYNDKQSVQNLAYEQDDVINLYALWTPTLYKVKYNLDGGAITGTLYDDTIGYYDKFTIESSDFTLPTTTISKNGAVFDGWYTSTDFSAAHKITKIEHGSYYDKEVYAKWNYQRTISVTIVSGDWSSSGGGGTEFTVTSDDNTPLSEGATVTGTSITLKATALTGYTYSWEIDGSTTNPDTYEEYSTSNTLTIENVSGWYWPNGVYDVVVSATNGTAYESFYLQIKVNN